MSLVSLGWTDFFEAPFVSHRQAGRVAGRVIQEHRNAYRVATGERELTGTLPGRLRHEARSRADLPAVGDGGALELLPGEDNATIQAVLPRRTRLARKLAGETTEEHILAANVDLAFLVCSLAEEPNARRIERMLTVAWESGASPVLVLNKADLCADTREALRAVEPLALGAPIEVVSCVTAEGLRGLARHLVGPVPRTAALLGPSGAGKSSLVNALSGETLREVGDLDDQGRGQHTTTGRALMVLPGGGLLVDTPGLREWQLWESERGLESSFADIEDRATRCRFGDCAHDTEPGCAVRAAIEEGVLSEERLASYVKLGRELRRIEARRDKRAQLESRKSAKRACADYARFERERGDRY